MKYERSIHLPYAARGGSVKNEEKRGTAQVIFWQLEETCTAKVVDGRRSAIAEHVIVYSTTRMSSSVFFTDERNEKEALFSLLNE